MSKSTKGESKVSHRLYFIGHGNYITLIRERL